ncbi:MAG: DHH family phosphoesterase [Methylococcales bacterium]|nr:DHH family phosphoesterase [Methylococcales bacterium]MCK5926472.1 DHH family phosphoesterase [Methylococcales bacterium]
MQIDVFNGDADGICALLQLRFAIPCKSILITGVKRDINLLSKVNAEKDDKITVLDISLAKNNHDVIRLLAQGVDIFYVDHHLITTIPKHPKLKTLINMDSNVCTSLLMNEFLEGAFYQWGVVGAFGDNMNQTVIKAVTGFCLNDRELEQLKILGICINYNAYGQSIEDLHIAPDVLYKKLSAYESPFQFIEKNPTLYQQLLTAYEADMVSASEILVDYCNDKIAVYEFPDMAWARRVNGVFANQLANKFPDRAHAILSFSVKNNAYQVSVRSPLNNKRGADELCSSFSTGGGRKSAAGINHLKKTERSLFIQRFKDKYQ